MTPIDALKAGALLFAAAVLQVSIVSTVVVWGGTPDLLLVTLLTVALLRGAIVGASAGFLAGLVVDTATLGTLGLTSLVLTLAGYWIGRYGETTGRDRAHAPFLSVAVVTVVAALGTLVLHYMLGSTVQAGPLLTSLPTTVLLNVVLIAPIYRLVRRALRPADWNARAQAVRLLG